MGRRFICTTDRLYVGHYIVWNETVGADSAILCIKSIEHIGDFVVINEEIKVPIGTEIICLGTRVVIK